MMAEFDAALVIGIAHYPSLRMLEGPVSDAERVALWLRGPAGLPDSNVELVVSDQAMQGRPILDEIDAAFDRIFARAESWESARRLYVYFAGHGCSHEIEHLALLMANADTGRLNRAMNATEYRKALAQRLFPEQVYMFDCCRNYDRTVTGRGPEWTIDPAAPPVDGLIQVVMYAAGFTEYANERHLIYNERRGLFTEALMEGLNGGAASGDGIVATDRLIPYVKDRLDELTRQENVRQHLWLNTHGVPRPLVLATGVTPERRLVSVALPPGTRRLVVRDERWHPVVDRKVALDETKVQVELEMSAYTVIAEPSGVKATIRMLPTGPTALDL